MPIHQAMAHLLAQMGPSFTPNRRIKTRAKQKFVQRTVQLRDGSGLQVKKEAEELERAFGTGRKLKLPGKIAMMTAKNQEGGAPEKAVIMIYGDPEKAAIAHRLLLECVENKEQKQKQRQKVCSSCVCCWLAKRCLWCQAVRSMQRCLRFRFEFVYTWQHPSDC
jgi:hypothetical protein